MRQLFGELKRRNVYKVAVTYAAVAFVTLQAARLIFPATTLEGLYDKLVVLAFVGFPIALVIAWAFELTPQGVQRTSTEEGEGEPPSRREKSRLAVTALVGIGLMAAALAGGWYLMGGAGEPGAESEPRAGDRSIAVLPFEALGQQEPGTFTEGMHDALLTRLSNVSGLTVISRTSVQQYRETDKTTAEIARELGVKWIVEGGVQEMGDQLQVNPRLVDPRTGSERWSESYRRDLTTEDLFAIQSEITKEIARSLEARLTPEEEERVERKPTGDLEAYRLYVRGRQQLAGRSFGFQVGWRIFEEPGSRQPPAGRTVELGPGEHLRRAVGYFRRAIERDSSFALAWAGLADAAAWYPSGVPDSAATLMVSQQDAARRALKLGPNLAEAHASMGFAHLANRNAPAAFRELTRALELKPSYWEAHNWLGELYLKIGRAQQALDHLTLAVELNPQHALARHWLYDTYLAADQPEKSLREARRQQRLGLEPVNAVAGEVRALYHLGRLDEARRLARKQISKLREQIWKPRKGLWPVAMRAHLAAVLAVQGDTAGAREQLDWLRAEEAELFWIGFVHATVGETDRALEAWERMELEAWGRIPAPHHLRYGILLDLAPLRDDLRYQELIREANRYWGLNPDGSLPDSVGVLQLAGR